MTHAGLEESSAGGGRSRIAWSAMLWLTDLDVDLELVLV